MTTISEVVEDLIRKAPFLEEALSDGIINVSSLARSLKPDIEQRLKKPVKDGAVVMAINRLSFGRTHKTNKALQMMSRLGDIVVRSDLSDFTFSNSDTLIKKESQLLDLVGKEKDLFCTFSQGVYETTLVVSSALAHRVREIFEGEKLLSSTSHLSSITMKLPKGNTEISGIYYYILKRIAWEGISVIEVISTTNEFTLVVNDEDVNRTFGLLMNIKGS